MTLLPAVVLFFLFMGTVTAMAFAPTYAVIAIAIVAWVLLVFVARWAAIRAGKNFEIESAQRHHHHERRREP